MASFNLVVLLGNLTRDPEIKYTPKGVAVASFGIAVNRKWKTESGEMKEEVTFVDCTAFGRVAEIIGDFVKKGNPLHIHGRLKLDQWDDKQTGAKRSKLHVIVETVQLLGSKEADEERPAAPARPAAAPAHATQAKTQTTARARQQELVAAESGPPPDDDDVPF